MGERAEMRKQEVERVRSQDEAPLGWMRTDGEMQKQEGENKEDGEELVPHASWYTFFPIVTFRKNLTASFLSDTLGQNPRNPERICTRPQRRYIKKSPLKRYLKTRKMQRTW